MYCLYLGTFKFLKINKLFNKSLLKNKNSYIIKNNFIFSPKNNILLKQNYLYKIVKLNLNHKFYIINKMSMFNFIKVLNNIFYNNNNFLFFDKDYKNIIPLYNNIYGLKNIKTNKDFFFLGVKNITLNNWFYFYKVFLKKNKVNILIFLEFYNFYKFFNIFSKFNLPIFSIIPLNTKPVHLDFFYFYNKLNSYFIKIYLNNYITSLYFYNYNLNKYISKRFYTKKLFKTVNFF